MRSSVANPEVHYGLKILITFLRQGKRAIGGCASQGDPFEI